MKKVDVHRKVAKMEALHYSRHVRKAFSTLDMEFHL